MGTATMSGLLLNVSLKFHRLRSATLIRYVTERYPRVNDEKWFLIFRVVAGKEGNGSGGSKARFTRQPFRDIGGGRGGGGR